MADRNLLMIPGPVEVSPAVLDALAAPPPSHTAPGLIDAFGTCLERMRRVWRASADSRPFVVAGGGTVAMEMAAANLVEPGERAVVVMTGYFGDRMAEMLRRQGAEVATVTAPVGDAPAVDEVARALAGGPSKALFVTHVDTSTGVRVDPEPLARLAREAGVLSVFDGVCATGGERFDMAGWGADVYLTGSQKALGLPPGLALMVISPAALEARRKRRALPPAMYLDWLEWLPVMTAYEERRPSYFSTPATHLIGPLAVALGEILDDGVEQRVERHHQAAETLRAAWRQAGLRLVPVRPELAADTLSALYLPEGAGGLVAKIAEHGVTVAGGLHPEIKTRSFRIGHMGWVVTRPELLERTADAVRRALAELEVASA